MESEAELKRFRDRNLLYGLPCAQCKIYYSAELLVCPVCQCRERVPASVPGVGLEARQTQTF